MKVNTEDEYTLPNSTWSTNIVWAQQSTVWTLGILLYKMVNGHHPFMTVKGIMEDELRFDGSLSRACCDLISQCLIRDPANRATLDEILQHKWVKQKLTKKQTRCKRRSKLRAKKEHSVHKKVPQN
ncbi:serine/threonine-protein kinase pim-2-like [Myxocyprinus asiaticus]|uniref:serine/threonine-protein kinase pim-2-like n=1 Tax=Myxocyprinus asiaticus TaxID=70543 RepID=UPI00222335DB|nr:serine/threonine-protein kinase pim-2-like [Myxocyprinus asiaticus]